MRRHKFFKILSGIISVVFLINSTVSAVPLTPQKDSLRALSAVHDGQTPDFLKTTLLEGGAAVKPRRRLVLPPADHSSYIGTGLKSSPVGASDIMPTGGYARFLLDWLNAAVYDEEDAQTTKIARKGLIRAAGGKIQEAIAGLVLYRDEGYMGAVGSLGTLDKLRAPEGLFTPGHDAYKALGDKGGALVAVNLVGYNQIEGHLKAAMKKDAGIILEIARSQLNYAMDEKTTLALIKETVERIGYKNPLVLHGDHIQYKEALFKAKAILKEEYEKVEGKGSFSDSIDIEEIDIKILEAVQARLKENSKKERKAIEGFVERLIKAGFTSIAIDASTIYDEIAGEAVLNYYLYHGTEVEQLAAMLEKDFMLPLEWGAEFLKMDLLDENDVKKFRQMKEKIAADMEKRGKTTSEIAEAIRYMADAFGILLKKARGFGYLRNFSPDEVIRAYDKIMKEFAEATIAGRVSDEVLEKMSDKQKLLLLPTNNAAETLHQLEYIDSMLRTHAPELLGHFGKEVEVGHIDRRVPNPRRGKKLEAKMTHPAAVKIMGDYITSNGQSFDLIATNNGSGHGTDFDKKTLTPVSQVGKISPWLTEELQEEADRFDAAIAQHGTSGSDMEELAVLAEAGVIKFNIATNYQQIILNVLSLLDDGLSPDEVLERSKDDREALVNGLHKDTREKIKRFAEAFAASANAATLRNDDSLFAEHLKRAYAWGVKKGKIKAVSSREDIATLLAKEFKRVFVEMNDKFYLMGHNASAKSSSAGDDVKKINGVDFYLDRDAFLERFITDGHFNGAFIRMWHDLVHKGAINVQKRIDKGKYGPIINLIYRAGKGYFILAKDRIGNIQCINLEIFPKEGFFASDNKLVTGFSARNAGEILKALGLNSSGDYGYDAWASYLWQRETNELKVGKGKDALTLTYTIKGNSITYMHDGWWKYLDTFAKFAEQGMWGRGLLNRRARKRYNEEFKILQSCLSDNREDGAKAVKVARLTLATLKARYIIPSSIVLLANTAISGSEKKSISAYAFWARIGKTLYPVTAILEQYSMPAESNIKGGHMPGEIAEHFEGGALTNILNYDKKTLMKKLGIEAWTEVGQKWSELLDKAGAVSKTAKFSAPLLIKSISKTREIVASIQSQA